MVLRAVNLNSLNPHIQKTHSKHLPYVVFHFLTYLADNFNHMTNLSYAIKHIIRTTLLTHMSLEQRCHIN